MHIKVESGNDALNLSKLLNDGNWMVLYYADWCGHCNTMKPEWQKVVGNLNNPQFNTNKVNVAEIESQHIGKLLNKPDIKGFPTIKMYNKGTEIADFKDERIASKIEEFANNNSKKKSMNNKSSKMNIKLTNSNLSNSPAQKTEIKLNEIKMNNLIKKINNKIEEPMMDKPMMDKPMMNKPMMDKPMMDKPMMKKSKLNILDLPCSSIIKAKPCKMNPKCMYDGSTFKCKDKIFKRYSKNKKSHKMSHKSHMSYMSPKMNKKSLKMSKKTPKMSKKTPKMSKKIPKISKKKSKMSPKMSPKMSRKSHKKNSNDVKKTTKSVFDQLIMSFGRIGNEAKKDSELLKKASNKLS